MGWDGDVASWVAGHRTGWATGFTDGLMWAGGSPYILLPLAALLTWWIVTRRAYWQAGTVVLATFCAYVGSALLKEVFQRPRPGPGLRIVDAVGWSMPSSDTALVAAAAAAVVVVGWSTVRARRWLLVPVVSAPVVIGLSVIYVGAHWMSDVLAGLVLGVAVGVGLGLAGRRASASRSGSRSELCA